MKNKEKIKRSKNKSVRKNITIEEQNIIEGLPTDEETLRGWNEKLPMILEGLRKQRINNSNRNPK